VGDTKPLLAGVSAPPGSESTRPCHAEPFCVAVILGKIAEKGNQEWMVPSWAAVAQQLGCRPRSQPGEEDFICLLLHREVDECTTSRMASSCTCKQEQVFQAVDAWLKMLRHGMLYIGISRSQPPALHQQQQQKHGLSRNDSAEEQNSTALYSTAWMGPS